MYIKKGQKVCWVLFQAWWRVAGILSSTSRGSSSSTEMLALSPRSRATTFEQKNYFFNEQKKTHQLQIEWRPSFSAPATWQSFGIFSSFARIVKCHVRLTLDHRRQRPVASRFRRMMATVVDCALDLVAQSRSCLMFAPFFISLCFCCVVRFWFLFSGFLF